MCGRFHRAVIGRPLPEKKMAVPEATTRLLLELKNPPPPMFQRNVLEDKMIHLS